MYFFPVSSLILIMVQLNVGSVHPVCMVSIVTGVGEKAPQIKLSLPITHSANCYNVEKVKFPLFPCVLSWGKSKDFV